MAVTIQELQRRVKQLEADVTSLKTGRTFNIASGDTQVLAGADVGVIWQDTNDFDTLKMGV